MAKARWLTLLLVVGLLLPLCLIRIAHPERPVSAKNPEMTPCQQLSPIIPVRTDTLAN